MIGSLAMMYLGGFTFGMKEASYQQLQRSARYRWATLDRAGRDPAAQYLGPGVETIRLNGVIYPYFRGGLGQVDAMRAVAKLGQPMMLVDGLGWVLQRWVILGIDNTNSFLLADGSPQKITFGIELQSYGADA